MDLHLGLLRGGWRGRSFLLAAASLLALCAAIGEFQAFHAETEWRIIAFFLLLPISLALTFTWPRNGTPGVQTAGILLLALAARLALFPHPVDSNVYRYLWEGRLVREGYDPYTHIAAAPEWTDLHDAYWQGMNQKDLRTIYPPLAEWIVAAAGGGLLSPDGTKGNDRRFRSGIDCAAPRDAILPLAAAAICRLLCVQSHPSDWIRGRSTLRLATHLFHSTGSMVARAPLRSVELGRSRSGRADQASGRFTDPAI